jgi:branched-chain amino acid transport system substrate-binding protein
MMRERFSFKLALAAIAFGIAIGCNGGSGTAGSGNAGTSTPTTSTEGGGGTTGARSMPTAEGNKATGEISIGLVASQNGELRPWGVDCVNGAKLAIEEFNKAGGVGGKQVKLLIEDSGSNPEQGKSAAEKLISSGVLGLVGEVSSGITGQMAQSAFEKGVPLVAVGATNPSITKIGANVFRVCYTDDMQGPVMARFAYEELNLRKVAVLTDVKQPYSTGLSASFAKAYKELGGEIVDEQSYETGQTQFSGQLTNLKAKNPDGLFLSGYFPEVGPIARQAKEAGLNVKMLGGDGWDSSEILNSGGEAILGSYFCNHYNNKENRPEVKDFLSRWTAKYGGEPATTMGALGYDATMLTLQALKTAKGTTSKDLTEALENTTAFNGVSGAINLKGNAGDPPKRALVVELTKQGQVFAKAYEASEFKK